MKTRLVLLASCAVFVVSPALAAKKSVPAENTITVIQDDGKAVTLEVDDADSLLPGAEGAAPFDMPAARSPEEDVSSAPEPARPVEPPQSKPLPDEIVKPGRYVDPIIAPPVSEPAKPAPAPAEKKGKKKQAEKPVKTTTKKASGQKDKKSRKSQKPVPPKPPVQKAVQRDLPPGTEITQRMAESIAMDSAPASSGFATVRNSYNGSEVYVVTFKTEDGPYDVLVDIASGKVVRSGYVETGDSRPTAPGHLPDDWEPFTPQPVGPPKE